MLSQSSRALRSSSSRERTVSAVFCRNLLLPASGKLYLGAELRLLSPSGHIQFGDLNTHSSEGPSNNEDRVFSGDGRWQVGNRLGDRLNAEAPRLLPLFRLSPPPGLPRPDLLG